jgi:hypothetical protein
MPTGLTGGSLPLLAMTITKLAFPVSVIML